MLPEKYFCVECNVSGASFRAPTDHNRYGRRHDPGIPRQRDDAVRGEGEGAKEGKWQSINGQGGPASAESKWEIEGWQLGRGVEGELVRHDDSVPTCSRSGGWVAAMRWRRRGHAPNLK